jgi:hypothetical protein
LGWRCTKCRDDDDAAAVIIQGEDAPLRVAVGWRCTKCRDDDDAASAYKVRLGAESPAVHSAWEKAFCAKIANVGAANFANARDCRIHVYAADGAKELQ